MVAAPESNQPCESLLEWVSGRQCRSHHAEIVSRAEWNLRSGQRHPRCPLGRLLMKYPAWRGAPTYSKPSTVRAQRCAAAEAASCQEPPSSKPENDPSTDARR